MNGHLGGNAQPTIDREEHRSIGGVDAKAVFEYALPVAKRVDTTVSNTIYIGQSAIGTANSAAIWQVKKIDTTNGADITWADGDSNYDNVWDNRASLTYS